MRKKRLLLSLRAFKEVLLSSCMKLQALTHLRSEINTWFMNTADEHYSLKLQSFKKKKMLKIVLPHPGVDLINLCHTEAGGCVCLLTHQNNQDNKLNSAGLSPLSAALALRLIKDFWKKHLWAQRLVPAENLSVLCAPSWLQMSCFLPHGWRVFVSFFFFAWQIH